MEPDIILSLDGPDGAASVEILAWHQVLVNASPYFRAMLSPDRFAEGTTLDSQKCLKLPLPETDPEAMQVICDVLHLRSNKVAGLEMLPEILHNVAILVDKFDCSEALWPWSQLWLKQDSIRASIDLMEGASLSLSEKSKWFRTCHSLGLPRYTERHLPQIIQSVSEHDIANDGFDMPQSVLNTIVEKRREVNERFVQIIEEELTFSGNPNTCKLVEDDDGWGYLSTTTMERFHCSSITAGNTMLAIKMVLGDNWRSQGWEESIQDMYSKMSEFANMLTGPRWVSGPPGRQSKKNPSKHQECCRSAQIISQVRNVMAELDIRI